MRLAVSNIAWKAEEEETVLEVLKAQGVDKLEVAPTRFFTSPAEVDREKVLQVRETYRAKGFSIHAAQALLFGKPELKFFTDKETTERTVSYLKKIVDFCSWLGVKPLVFGSPKNRLKGEMSFERAVQEWKDPLRELGAYAVSKGCVFCVEPNAKDYGCDFIQTIEEATQLLKAVDHPGVGLNIDLGVLTMNQEPLAEALGKAVPWATHFHISEPHLELISEQPHHTAAAQILSRLPYKGLLSIEMRSKDEGNAERVETAVKRAKKTYERLLG